MTSKIINMADRMKDAEDRIFESLFAAEPIADEGFSDRIVKRIRRHIWIQRLTLPAAMLRLHLTPPLFRSRTQWDRCAIR